MKRFAALVFLGFASLALSGCAGSAGGPSLFLLDTSYPTDNAFTVSTPVLIVDPVTVAPYLDQGGIVYQTGPHRVVVANNNRWASPLATQLTDGLYAALGGALDDVSLTRDKRGAPIGALHLATHVEQFMGHYDGYAHVAGRWQLIGPDGARLASQTFDRRIPLRDDGYAALVDSLSQGWRMTAEAMAPALAKDISTR